MLQQEQSRKTRNQTEFFLSLSGNERSDKVSRDTENYSARPRLQPSEGTSCKTLTDITLGNAVHENGVLETFSVVETNVYSLHIQINQSRFGSH